MDKRFIGCYVKAIDEDRREIYARASVGVLDRDREIIRWDAWVDGLEDFKAHPILLIGHAYGGLWVARVTKIEVKKDGLFFRAVFATTAAGEEAWQTVKSTQTAAFSVGFLPVASQDYTVKALLPDERKSALAAGLQDSDRVKVHTRARLMEISMVAVPSCPSALLIAYKAGRIKTKALRAAVAAAVQDNNFLTLDDERRKYNSRGEREFDINNPAELKELLESALGHDNLKRIIGSRIKLALDKARGKVY